MTHPRRPRWAAISEQMSACQWRIDPFNFQRGFRHVQQKFQQHVRPHAVHQPRHGRAASGSPQTAASGRSARPQLWLPPVDIYATARVYSAERLSGSFRGPCGCPNTSTRTRSRRRTPAASSPSRCRNRPDRFRARSRSARRRIRKRSPADLHQGGRARPARRGDQVGCV
jgi:hypothetical protein